MPPLVIMLIAYGMGLLSIGSQMRAHGISPFPPGGDNSRPGYPIFWEDVTPSLWALPGLVVIHIFCWLENLTLERARAAQAAPTE